MQAHEQVQIRRTGRNETYDLRDQLSADDHDHHSQGHYEATNYNSTSEDEHSVLEDDSDGEERDVDYIDDDDDGSSSLSIPNESIDFDLVYSLHSFAATVEGQANVVKGDSLFLMDDSNSYWWLVRVLKTQEVGYIPAENIETPFERLARLNKHRNVDLASATQTELQEDVHASRDRLRTNLSSRQGSNSHTPSPIPQQDSRSRSAMRSRQTKGVAFTPSLSVHRYPPAVWGDEEEDEEDVEWDDEGYEGEDVELADEQAIRERQGAAGLNMEPDDGMGWDDSAAEDMQNRTVQGRTAPASADSHMSIAQEDRTMQADAQVQPEQDQLQQQQLVAQQQKQQPQDSPQSLRQQPLRSAIPSPRPSPSTPASGSSATTASSASIPSPSKVVADPAEATETRKLSVTPTIAREGLSAPAPAPVGPLLPSAIMQRQDDERKRTREEIEVLEEAARKRAKGATVTKQPPVNGAKLRKEQPSEEESAKEKGKKSGGIFGLFGRKKDKDKKDKASSSSISSVSIDSNPPEGRASEESGLSSSHHSHVSGPEGVSLASPVTAVAIQQQQQHQMNARNMADPRRTAQQPSQGQQIPQQGIPPPQQGVQAPQQQSPPSSAVAHPQVSAHASQLRQRDQQQQALYQQQYLNRSPASPPEERLLSTAASSASAMGLALPPSGSRPRPGSLLIDGQVGVGVPELSVIRVFAGDNLQTEATFKTVLLNTSTTSADLVRQAIQRFRLPAGEEESDYYLTVKQVEGSSARLRSAEKPLVVFESLVEAAMELPKVKRSSVGSISSIASNLSMHPAIKKLSMNDFTDDSAVKFYLNRKVGGLDEAGLDEGDDTLLAESSQGDLTESSLRSHYLSPSLSSASNVSSDRFSSPSLKFALQLYIYRDDLPDDMVFDPMTEAIVFKNTLRDRSSSSSASSASTVPQNFRRKIFVFPKNVTVAEVIELGLERFGIIDGVVDGGDEVEDKLTKRRSMSRVRYGLNVQASNQERELSPSSKVIEAFPRPPVYRSMDKRSSDSKRRSIDSAVLLGTIEDVQPDDPAFVLRRSVAYRHSSSRHRTSAPLDELALRNLHRESASSSAGSDTATIQPDDVKGRQMSKQELIAAQRAASRANQRALLSTQTNSVRGVDVLLPGNAVIRSSRFDSGDRMRYSYVEPDGETYDISDIVEEEWSENMPNKNDLLVGVFARNKDGLDEKLDRVLNKIKDGKATIRNNQTLVVPPDVSDGPSSANSQSSSSEYSVVDHDHTDARSPTPVSAAETMRALTPPSGTGSGSQRGPSPAMSAGSGSTRSRTATPTTSSSSRVSPADRRQPSIASVMSDLSYATAPTPPPYPSSPKGSRSATVLEPRPRPHIPKDDFGIGHMIAIIELGATAPKMPVRPLDAVDEALFGQPLEEETLHPQIREIYSDSFKRLREMDDRLDEFLLEGIPTF